jgi:CheY-like chemotaxis protein
VRLEEMKVGLLRRALAIYAEVGWAGATPPAMPELPGRDEDPLEPALEALIARGAATDETLRAGEVATRIFTLRLGNPRYPFMKLVLQEHLVEGMYFLGVDTHDQMFGADASGGPEQEELQALKHYNLEVRERIERAWNEAGLPTAAQIKGLVATWPTRRELPNGRRILVVDNDRDIAATLALLLEARGYQVTVLGDGRECVEQADPARHDLIIMDNEMLHLDGFEACRLLKARNDTKRIPVLIATAGALSLQQLDAADGFLVKPFRMELLFSILDHMLGRKDRT